MKDLPIWTPLASVALALSWMLPNASPPWIAFHKDAWLAGVMWIVMVVWLIKRRATARESYRLDVFGALLLVMAVMTGWQWWIGIVHFSGHFALAVLYLAGAALAIVLGRDWSRANPFHFGDFLFQALLLAAVGTSFLLLVQWLQLPWMGVWIQEVAPTHQPYGNLNQPNNAATLLVLGMVSISWLAYRGQVGPNVWLAACAYLSLCVAVTGSRIGYLSLTSLTLIAMAIGWSTEVFRPWRNRALCLLAAFAAALVLAHVNLGSPTDTQAVIASSPQAFQRDLTTARVFLWKAYATTAMSNPWHGFGFEQGFLTQLAAGELGFDLRGLFTWSHNAILDVATWFGLPVAVIALGLVLWVLVHLARETGRADRWIHVAGIYAVVLHGMVELPMAFAYFLVPVCLMAGAVLASLRMPSLSLPSPLVAGWTVALGLLLGAVIYDYLRIEKAFYTWRFEHARIGRNHPMDVPDTLVLNQFEAMLIGLRGKSDNLTTQQVDDFEKAIVHSPSLAAIQHLAEIRMRRGDVKGSQRAADMAVLTAKPYMREAMAARWRYLTLINPEFAAVQWREQPDATRIRPD